MPMIDVTAPAGAFKDKKKLARDVAAAVMRWERVPDISLFRKNTAAFVHEVASDSLANVDGDSNYVRVDVLTPASVLDREKKLGIVKEITEIVAAAAEDPGLIERTWVVIREAPDGGWGIAGFAYANADIAAAARKAVTEGKG